MEESEVEEKVIAIVAEQMGVDKSEIFRDTNFVNDLNTDSLDAVELVMEFEDEFEVPISDEQAANIQTIGQAIDFIKGRVVTFETELPVPRNNRAEDLMRGHGDATNKEQHGFLPASAVPREAVQNSTRSGWLRYSETC